MFLLWFDPDKSTPTIDKIRQAVGAYTRKFDASPTVCYMSQDDAMPTPEEVAALGIRVAQKANLRTNNYAVGDDAEVEALAAAAGGGAQA